MITKELQCCLAGKQDILPCKESASLSRAATGVSMATSNEVHGEEIWLDTPTGRLFAKRWRHVAIGVSARPPLILLHDSLGSVDQWRELPANIARATMRPVVAYDRLGFGRSDPHPGQVPLDFIRTESSRSFRHVKEGLAIDRFAIFGHSVGGGMAVGIAAAYPLLCESFITLSAQAFVEDRTLSGISAAQRAFAQPGQIDRLRRYHGDKAAWVLNAWIDRWLDPAFVHWSLDPELPHVVCPGLVLHGSRDEYGSHLHPERIARLATGPTAMHIGEWGHVPHREQPEEIVRRVSRHLAKSPTSPA